MKRHHGKLYGLFRREGRRWVRVGTSAFLRDTAAAHFAPYLSQGAGTYAIRPVGGYVSMWNQGAR